MVPVSLVEEDQPHQVSSSSLRSMKLERKIVERNRRNHMKTLYSHLFSLLPTSYSNQVGSAAAGILSSSPGPAVADQVDEAISYIKSLESKLKKLEEEKKEKLAKKTSRKRVCTGEDNNCRGPSKAAKRWSAAAPGLQIREVGSVVEVNLTSGSGRDEQPIVLFQDVIRILEDDQRLEVVNASFAIVAGNSGFHSTVHAKIKESCLGFEAAARVSERLQRLVYASISDPELEAELCDLAD